MAWNMVLIIEIIEILTQSNYLYADCLLLFSFSPVGELAGDDVLQMFFKERELNGDFISKASDMLWQRKVMKFVDAEAGTPSDTHQQPEGVQ